METIGQALVPWIRGFDVVVLVYFLLANTWQAILMTSAAWSLRDHRRRSWYEHRDRLLGSAIAPTISVLAPAHNEEATVAEAVRALLTLQYPSLEIVVVNDGSSDATLEVLRHTFDLRPYDPLLEERIHSEPVRGLYRSVPHPQLVVVDKENGGKADALNAALNIASSDLVCAIDADTLIEPDALLRIGRPFIVGDGVVAAGGTIRVVNDSEVRAGRLIEPRVPKRVIPGVQAVEYLRAFLFGRLGWNRLGGNLIISGAFGLFRRDAVMAAGGYVHDTVGEDMELVADLRRGSVDAGHPMQVAFVPDPVAWTEVPATLRVLGRQRDRWHRGLADVLWRHRRAMLRPRYGALGLVVLPYFLFVELLAPVVEVLGLLGLAVGLGIGAVDTSFALLFFLVAYGYGLIISISALAIEEWSFHRYTGLRGRIALVLYAIIETVGYRQLTVWWRLRGLSRWLRRGANARQWGAMERRGFGATQVPGSDGAE